MNRKKQKVVSLACGLAASALIALPTVVQAQDSTGTTGGSTGGTTGGTSTTMSGGGMTGTMSGDMSGGMSGGMGMSSQPMQVTGTVLRYYTDRGGYVTAMDVQTANGVQMVRFSPGMAQRIYTTYPVGSQASVYVTGSQMNGMTRMDAVSIGDTMPTSETMMMPYMVSDTDLLEATPYIQAGAKLVTVRGELQNVITNDRGEVVGLVLGDAKVRGKDMKKMAGAMSSDASMSGGAMAGGTSGSTMSGDAAASGTMSGGAMTGTMTGSDMGGGMMSGGMMGGGMMMSPMTIVRVGPEFRQLSTMGTNGSDRVTPLFRGSKVEVTGYPEAPRYGVVSSYGQRISATAIVVNRRSVGSLGFPMVAKGSTSLFRNVNIGSREQSPEEMHAMGMGYSTYNPNMDSGMTGTMSGEGTMGGSTMGGGGTSGSGGMTGGGTQ